MKDLIELIQILSKQKTYSIQIIGENFNGDTKLEQLYNGILNGEYMSDEEAAEQIYQSNSNGKAYKKLRTNLKKQLINTVFFIDRKSADFNEYQKAYYNTCKEWAAMKILLGREARVAAIMLAQKIIRQAKQFEFTEITLDTARILRMHYAVFEGDQSKAEQYDELVREQMLILEEEAKAEMLYEGLVLRYVNSKSTQTEIAEEAARAADVLRPVIEKHPTHRIGLCLYLIEVMRHMSINDYARTLEICQEAIAFFERKEYNAKVTLITFLYQQLACEIKLRDYAAGEQTAEKCLSMLSPGPTNWFRAMELYFMLSLHSGQYSKAFGLMQQAMKNNRFQFQAKTQIETWKIYEAFARALFEMDMVELDPKVRKPGKFRVGKFLNEVPIFSKDKSGMNIPIIIIQLLFMLLHGKTDELIDREESIRRYCNRHLREEDTHRSDIFIKMLLLFPSCSFDKNLILEKAAPMLEELAALPLESASQSFEIEIVPYEALWELICNRQEIFF
jgi:hypothetical protein